MSVGAIGVLAWRDLGGPAPLLARIGTPPALRFPGRLDVTGLACDSVAIAILAVHRVLAARGMVAEPPAVRVSGARIASSYRSERVLSVDGVASGAWSPLSGFWETADGWVRTHGNYPHHADRLRALLDVSTAAAPSTLRAVLRRRSGAELEDLAAELGAILVRVRTPEEWAAHPQSAAVRAEPLIDLRRIAEAAPRSWTGSPKRPLDGVRVLDLTRVIAGPVATRDLAFAGAQVLRIDPTEIDEIPWQHLDTGQGKRSTRLDLGSRDGRAVFERLLADADVLVTGYRPGSLARLGLDPDSLAERHAGLVLASVSAWGVSGPWAERRGFDSIVQAASGIARIEANPEGEPGALPAQALDHSAGHLLAAGIMTALLTQREGGGAHDVRVSLARVAEALLAGPRRSEPAEAELPPPTLQHGRTEGVPLTTAAPVLTYRGAPAAYPEVGRPWAADPPSWWDAAPVAAHGHYAGSASAAQATPSAKSVETP